MYEYGEKEITIKYFFLTAVQLYLLWALCAAKIFSPLMQCIEEYMQLHWS
jgi:hypothetical protein